jgi:ubiquitin C-terminal hydrolase
MFLSLKRSGYDANIQRPFRIETKLVTPQTLNMALHASKDLELSRNDSKYELVGDVRQVGRVDAGHYYTYVKIDGTWKIFKD